MTSVTVIALGIACAGLLARQAATAARDRARPRHARITAPGGRILFPFVAGALSEPGLDATLRLARSERATLVPAYLARVPMHLPLPAPLPRECTTAMALLEAIEHRAAREGVAVDARIERGRTYRHALRELLAHEPSERVVVAADATGAGGFDAADVAWLLEHATGEVLVLRPARQRTPNPSPLDSLPMSLDSPM